MLVCPYCRGENLEEARFCNSCGRTLESQEMALRRIERREGDAAFIDFPPPKSPSPVPGIVGLVLLGVALLAGSAWYFLRPDPCAGKFASTQFPYCLAVPRGWQAAPQRVQDVPADLFAPQASPPVVLVTSEQIPPGVDATAYADVQRQQIRAGGLFPSPIEQDEVGGSEALAWETTRTDTDGTVLRERMVILVRDGRAWQILMVSAQQDYRHALAQLESMLDTWSWI